MVYSLLHFDAQLNLTGKRKLDLKHEGNSLKYQFMTQVGGSQYLFTSYHNPSTGKECLLAQKVGPDHLSLEDPIKVVEVEDPEKDGFFRFQPSDGGSYLLLAYNRTLDERNEQGVDLFVLDKELKESWRKENCLSDLGASFTVEQYRVDESGNAYLLSTLFSDKRVAKRQGAPDYQYYLSSFRNKGIDQEHFGIKLKDKFVTDLQIKLTPENEIKGGGFYADEGSFRVKGSYFFTIDASSNKVISRSVKEFEPDFLSQQVSPIPSNTRSSDNKLRQYGFSLKDIFLREDGSAVLLGEEYFVSSITTFNHSSRKAKSRFFYDFNDVVIINVSPDGVIDWAEKIEKQQRSSDDAGLYSSFTPIQAGGSLYILYNSFSFASRSSAKYKKGRGAELRLAHIDRSGEISAVKIPGLPPTASVLIPKSAVSTGRAGVVLLAGERKKKGFVKVRIKKLDALSSR